MISAHHRGPHENVLPFSWGEEPQHNERAFAPGGSEGYGACGDEGAPSFVEQKQLDELNIACTAKEEE